MKTQGSVVEYRLRLLHPEDIVLQSNCQQGKLTYFSRVSNQRTDSFIYLMFKLRSGTDSVGREVENVTRKWFC
jgi:hypothetical protein